MNNEESLVKIDSIKTALAVITDVKDARKLLSIAEGLLVATRKEYIAIYASSQGFL